MNFLEERIVKDGVVKEGNVLKVDSFLNHQMDIKLLDQMGAEFKRRFAKSRLIKFNDRSVGDRYCLRGRHSILMCRLCLQRNRRVSILTEKCM